MNSTFWDPSRVPSVPRVRLDDVRNLELRYTRARPETIELIVEYVGGQVKVFEVDRFLIERLLEHLEQMGHEDTARGHYWRSGMGGSWLQGKGASDEHA